MDKKLLLIIFSLVLTTFVFAQDEEWKCETEVENKSGTLEISRCRKSDTGMIACYEDIKETCKERNSGKKSTREYRSFTGSCVNSFSDCW